MNRQLTVDGERLFLRPLRPDDWKALFAVAADSLVWQQHPTAELGVDEDRARWDERLKKVAKAKPAPDKK